MGQRGVREVGADPRSTRRAARRGGAAGASSPLCCLRNAWSYLLSNTPPCAAPCRRAGDGAPAAAAFPRGTIKLVKLHNFMTYSGTVVIKPGSKLNLVLGPNGEAAARLGRWLAVPPAAPGLATLFLLIETPRPLPRQARASRRSCAPCASASGARPR